MDRSGRSYFPNHLYGRLVSGAAPIAVGAHRPVRLRGVLVAAALLACAPARAGTEAAETTIDLTQHAPLTDDFEFLPAATQLPWTLIEDTTAAGGFALEQRGTPTNANHSLAAYKPVSVKDAEISLRIKATGGEKDQGGGIALRLTAPDSYYLVEIDARRDRVVFLRVANGSAEEIVAVDADIATNAWHKLTVRAVDDEFVVSLDGVWAFTAFDKALSRAGRVALWTPADSVTRFDSLAIAPPSPSAQPW